MGRGDSHWRGRSRRWKGSKAHLRTQPTLHTNKTPLCAFFVEFVGKVAVLIYKHRAVAVEGWRVGGKTKTKFVVYGWCLL